MFAERTHKGHAWGRLTDRGDDVDYQQKQLWQTCGGVHRPMCRVCGHWLRPQQAIVTCRFCGYRVHRLCAAMWHGRIVCDACAMGDCGSELQKAMRAPLATPGAPTDLGGAAAAEPAEPAMDALVARPFAEMEGAEGGVEDEAREESDSESEVPAALRDAAFNAGCVAAGNAWPELSAFVADAAALADCPDLALALAPRGRTERVAHWQERG